MNFTDEDFEKAATISKDITEEFICYAKSKDAIEKLKQKDTETYVLNITRDFNEQVETSIEWKKYPNKQENENPQNVNVVIEMLEEQEHLDCAINITKCLNCMETLCTLTEELDRHTTAIIGVERKGKPNTEKYMRITLEENLHPMKLYTILTLLKLITESKIYTSTLRKVNIQGYIASCENSENNTEKMQISNLKMEGIYTRTSSSQLYKQAGNSIVVSVLMATFSQLNIKGVKCWNDMSETEKYELIYKNCGNPRD